jgi:hypothetical protein
MPLRAPENHRFTSGKDRRSILLKLLLFLRGKSRLWWSGYVDWDTSSSVVAATSYAPTGAQDRLTFWLCVGLGLTLGLLVYSGKSWHLLIALGVPLILLVFLSEEALVVILLLAHFSLDWLVLDFHLPSKITWGVEGIIAILAGKALLRMGYEKVAASKAVRLIFVLLIFSGLSVLVNFVDPMSAMLGFRKWFRYPLMYWALSYTSLHERFAKLAIWLFVALMLLQVPVCAFQKFFGSASMTSTGDLVVGTLGAFSTHSLGVLCAVAVCLLIGLYKETKEKRLLYLLPLLFVPPTIAEVKAFYFFAVLVCLYLLKEDILRNPRGAFAWATSFILLMIGSFALYDSIYTYREKDVFRTYEAREREPLAEFLLSPQKMLAFETRNRSIKARGNSERRVPNFGRIETVMLANSAVRAGWSTTVFGYGPGSYTKSSLKDDTELTLLKEAMTQHLISSALIELGYGGLILIAILLWFLYQENKARQEYYENPFWRGIARGFQGVVILMAASSLYVGSFLYGEQTSFVFWLLLALFPHQADAGEQAHGAAVGR